VGEFAGWHFDLQGKQISAESSQQNISSWLPTQADRQFIKSLMKAETRPGYFAGWIAPPLKGINGQALDFSYVKLG
jgi:benzoyl-CoA 2,3-dioxygenase component B